MIADYRGPITAIRTSREIPLLPVLVQGARMVDPSHLPPGLEGLVDLQAVELDTKHFDRDIEELYRFIDTAVGFGGTCRASMPARRLSPASSA